MTFSSSPQNERGTPRSLSPVSQGLQSRVPPRHAVTELHDVAATRAAVDATLPNSEVLLYFGHGSTNHLGANQPLVDAQNLRDDQLVIAIACHAGAGLGPQVFGSTASGGFIGFDCPLIHPRKSPSRANDAYETALDSFLCSVVLLQVKSALEGELLRAANDYLTKPVRYRISRMEALIVFASLRSNTIGLVRHGDSGAHV